MSLPARLLPAAAAAFAWLVQPAVASEKNFEIGARSYEVGMYNTAARYWMTMAEKGNGAAQYNIGRMLYYGQGARQDPIEAFKWFLLASENGIEQGRIAAHLLADKMTREQVVEATVRARDLRRKYAR